MEPVLTQEELEAIYSAMNVDDVSASAVDDIALTAGQEFISQAEEKWTEAARSMSERVETVLTSALGKRMKIEIQRAETIEPEMDDDYGSQDEQVGAQFPSIGEDASQIFVVSFGGVRLLLGIDRTLAMKFIERRTGAPPDMESQGATAKEFTALEQRLLSDLVGDVAFAAADAVPRPCEVMLESDNPEEVWAKRSKDEIWINIRFGIVQHEGVGLWLRGPATVFLPQPAKARQTLADRLRSTKVELSVELGKTKISLTDLWNLSPGTLLSVDTTVGDLLPVLLGGVHKLQGEPLVSRGNIAVRIKGRTSEAIS